MAIELTREDENAVLIAAQSQCQPIEPISKKEPMFKFIAYLPTYLLTLWHNVWYIGLISVFSTFCYKTIVTILNFEVCLK